MQEVCSALQTDYFLSLDKFIAVAEMAEKIWNLNA